MASSATAEWTQTTPNTSAWLAFDNNNNNQSLTDLPEDCFLLGLNATIPWDNPGNLIAYETESLIERGKSALLIVLFLVGFPCNVVNMAVFYKQGLKDRINMCLFSLAVADILTITFIFVLYAERAYNLFTGDDERYPASFRYIMNHNAIGLFGLMYGPPLLSAIISTERCICVLFPLRAQRCVSTGTLAAVIVGTLTAVTFFRFLVTSMFRISCFHEVVAGRTSWQTSVNKDAVLNKAALKTFDGVIYGFCIAVGCPVVVFFTTIITAIKLSQIVKWRRQASSSISSSSSSSSKAAMSSKEVGVTKMLLCLSAEFFVLSIPFVASRIWPMFNKELSPAGLYANSYRILVRLQELCCFLSSSVNFFVYYSTGTKFRETLRAMLAAASPPGSAGAAGRKSQTAASKCTVSQTTSGDFSSLAETAKVTPPRNLRN